MSGEYLFAVLLVMLHPTQVLEPPANPARFSIRNINSYAAEFRQFGLSGQPQPAAADDESAIPIHIESLRFEMTLGATYLFPLALRHGLVIGQGEASDAHLAA
jgi:hypothetical protein